MARTATERSSAIRSRVVLALSDDRLADRLRDPLAACGFDVRHARPTDDGLADVLADVPWTDYVLVLDEHDDWLRLVTDLASAMPGVRPVVLAELTGPDEFLAAVVAGVAGFCAPSSAIDAIVRTIDSVRAFGFAIPRDQVAPLVDQVRHGRGRTVSSVSGAIEVTDREWQTLILLMQRRSTREMADALFVSVGTVRSHVSSLLRKLGAADREDAIRMVERGAG